MAENTGYKHGIKREDEIVNDKGRISSHWNSKTKVLEVYYRVFVGYSEDGGKIYEVVAKTKFTID